jgi:hypothetical protein
MRSFTANSVDPVAQYKRLPGLLANEPADEPVNLDIPSEALKHRQLVAYFLRRPVIADWSDDTYVTHFLPGPAHLGPDARFPSLVYSRTHQEGSVASLTFHRQSGLLVNFEFGPGWYDEERAEHSWWRWLDQRGEIDVIVTNTGWLTLRGEIAIVGAPRRTVTIAVAGDPGQTRSYPLTERWFTPFSAERIHLAPGRHRLVIAADGAGRVMGPRDPRTVRIGLRNITWTLTPD